MKRKLYMQLLEKTRRKLEEYIVGNFETLKMVEDLKKNYAFF